MRKLVYDLTRAFGLLTRLPMPRYDDDTAMGYPRSVWAYPTVGAVVGAISAIVWFAAQFAGLGPALAAGLAVGAQLLVTGAMHEDGLADFADGMGGGRDRETRLAIMRDSRVGSFGVVALVMVTGLRWAAVAALALDQLIGGLICSAMIGRLAMALVLGILSPARETGMGAMVARPPLRALAVAVAVSVALVFAYLPAVLCAAIFAAAALAAGWVAFLAKRAIGGYTGDVLGAAGLAAETAVLLVLAGA